MPRKTPPPPIADSLEEWFTVRNPELKLANFQRVLMLELERLAMRETKHRRLLCMMPPGHAKTTLGTFTFAPWYMNRHPKHSVLVLSYDEKRSVRFGRRIRNDCRTAAAQEGFPGLAPVRDSHAAGFFVTEQGNECYAAGFNGPLAGTRTDCVVGHTLVTTKEHGVIPVTEVYSRMAASRTGVLSVLGVNHRSHLLAWGTVRAVRRRLVRRTYELRSLMGRNLTLTGRHRVYIPPYGYKAAMNLCRGMELCTPDQFVPDRVQSLDTSNDPIHVYDLEVEGTHNFFANGILIHNCILLDDPVKSMVEARSEARMEEIFDIYRSVVKQRLKPGGIMVVYLTRYGMRDFAGRLIEAENTRWKQLLFPAEQPDGSGRYLWSEYHGKAVYEEAKEDPEVWWSVWQQQPKQLSNHVFRPEWLMYWDATSGWVPPEIAPREAVV